jgi:hypothetical protein
MAKRTARSSRPKRPDPTSLRLAPAEVARVEALRAPMAKASGLAAANVSRHAVLLAVIHEGLAVLERRHKVGSHPRGE